MLEIEVKSSDLDGFKNVNTGDLARKWRMISVQEAREERKENIRVLRE